MQHSQLCELVTLAAISTTPAIAAAETFVFPFPTAPLSIFGLQFSADHLGPVDGTITGSTVNLTLQTDGSFDASNLRIQLQAPTGDDFPLLTLTGAELGWTSGAGTFNATVKTDAFNGPILIGELDPKADFSLWLISLSSVSGPLGGQLIDSTWEVEVGPDAAPADLNGDGSVDGLDLGILLAHWSIPAGSPGCGGAMLCAADINGDGVVDGLDLGILLASWTL